MARIRRKGAGTPGLQPSSRRSEVALPTVAGSQGVEQTGVAGSLLLLPVLIALVAFAYQPAWHGGLLWDDEAHLTKPELRSLDGLGRIWTDVGATQQYYPLLHTAFWLQHRLWGAATTGYHLLGVGLHAISAWLLARLLARLAVPGATLAAVLFALHPVHVESVAWISELKNTLSGVFVLSAALAYVRFDESRDARRNRLATGLFVLALLTKSVTAMLAPALAVVLWWRRGRVEPRRDLLPLLPLFALGAAAGLLTAWLERAQIGAEGAAFDLSWLARLAIAGRAFWFYLGKLAWPVDLAFVYPRWEVSRPTAADLLPAAAALALVCALWAVRRWSRAPLAAAAIFALLLLPALGFVNVYPFRYSFVADHFQYLASIPILALAAAGIATAAGRSTRSRGGEPVVALAVAGVVAAAPLAALTWKQSHDYADGERLYRATIARNPGAWLAHNNLGLILWREGKLEEARTHLLEALRLQPDVAEHRLNAGRLLLAAGQPAEALPQLEAAVRLDPWLVTAHNNLGVALLRLGRPEQAIPRFAEALRLRADLEEARANMASAQYGAGTHLVRAGRMEEAVRRFEEALRFDPQRPDVRSDLGVALQVLGRPEAALPHLREAVRLRPGDAAMRNNLGTALLALGRRDEAASEFRAALRIAPELAAARENLARSSFR